MCLDKAQYYLYNDSEHTLAKSPKGFFRLQTLIEGIL